jgi:diacylglycerol O-acyltransferase / wax synthase
MSERIQLERLSPLDASNLRVEDRGVPMHVAALVILDRTPLGSSRQDGLEAVRAAVERRLHLAPRLRQALYRPRPGLGPAVWVDHRGFDIRQHVLGRGVPAPGDEAALLSVCQELNSGRLDRSRPLWEMWVLDGLAYGHAAILIRLHHVVADGVAALAMMAALFDPGSGLARPVPAAPEWVPRPVPGARELAADALHRQCHAAVAAVARMRHPEAVAARLSVLARQAGRLAREGRAPRVSLNVPVGEHRLIRLVRADLELARAVAHAHGGTLNDIVLAAVAGGAQGLLGVRSELRPGLELKASVPVSVRSPADPPRTGNRVGVMVVPLPVGDADAGRRLRRIAQATAERKRLPPVMMSPGWMPALAAAPPGVTLTTPTPAGCPLASATVWAAMPSDARPELLTFPVAMSCPAMLATVSLGIAKPIPAAAPPSCGLVAASVGMPITCPARFTRAPPLLPGLMAALVWIALVSTAELPCPSETVRPVAETMPSVTVPVPVPSSGTGATAHGRVRCRGLSVTSSAAGPSAS